MTQSMTAPLRRVLVRPPGADLSRWREYGWRSEPDAARIGEEHETLCAALEQAGAEVVVGERPADGNVDAIYVFDPALVTDTGAILLRPAKESRRDEVAAIRADFERQEITETRRRMEAAGVDVKTYRGEELSRKGDGGPTCLTRPLARG